MAAVESLCKKGLLLEKGLVLKNGAVGNIVNFYLTSSNEEVKRDLSAMPSAGTKKVTIKQLQIMLDGEGCKMDSCG